MKNVCSVCWTFSQSGGILGPSSASYCESSCFCLISYPSHLLPFAYIPSRFQGISSRISVSQLSQLSPHKGPPTKIRATPTALVRGVNMCQPFQSGTVVLVVKWNHGIISSQQKSSVFGGEQLFFWVYIGLYIGLYGGFLK